MLKVTNILFCKKAIVDRQSGAMSIIEIIEQINVGAIPINLLELTLVVFFERNLKKDKDVQKILINIRINDKKIGDAPQEIQFGNEKKSKSIVLIPFIVISEIGNLHIEVMNKTNKLISNLEIPIVVDEKFKDTVFDMKNPNANIPK